MAAIRSLLRLPATDRSILIESIAVLWMVRLGFWLLPFKMTRRLLNRASSTPGGPAHEDAAIARQVSWAVTKAARYVPASTCLARAFTTQLLLVRRGQAAEVRIGVAKNSNGRLEAHAWVESYGKVVMGKLRDPSQFARMPPLPVRKP